MTHVFSIGKLIDDYWMDNNDWHDQDVLLALECAVPAGPAYGPAAEQAALAILAAMTAAEAAEAEAEAEAVAAEYERAYLADYAAGFDAGWEASASKATMFFGHAKFALACQNKPSVWHKGFNEGWLAYWAK